MKKSSMPGHLIAVLILLGLVMPTIGVYPALMVPLLLIALGLPMLMITGLLVASGLWIWCLVLVIGLLLRQPWGLRNARITAGLTVLGGTLAFALGLGAGVASGHWELVGFGLDFAAVPLGLGGYMMWALGRADVRTWLEQAS